MDGPAGLGLSRRDPAGIRTRLAAARPIGFGPARWLAADICVYLAFKDRYQSPFCRLRRRRGHCRPRRASPSVSKAMSVSSPAPIPPSTAFTAVRHHANRQWQFQLQRQIFVHLWRRSHGANATWTAALSGFAEADKSMTFNRVTIAPTGGNAGVLRF